MSKPLIATAGVLGQFPGFGRHVGAALRDVRPPEERRVAGRLVEPFAARAAVETAGIDEQPPAPVDDGRRFPQPHARVVVEPAAREDRVPAGHAEAGLRRVRIAAVERVFPAPDVEGDRARKHLGQALRQHFALRLRRPRTPLALAVERRPLANAHALRRHRAAPDMAARQAVRAAPHANADRVVNDEDVRQVAVGDADVDADVPGKPLHVALGVDVVGHEFVEIALLAARDLQPDAASVVERDVREREVMRVREAQAAREPVPVDVPAPDEEAEVVVDPPVRLEERERDVVAGRRPREEEVHLPRRDKMRGGMHLKRAAVRDDERRGNCVLAPRHLQNAVRGRVDRTAEARRVVRLARTAREVRQVRVRQRSPRRERQGKQRPAQAAHPAQRPASCRLDRFGHVTSLSFCRLVSVKSVSIS